MTMNELICSYYTVAGTPPRTPEQSRRPLADRAKACADAGFAGMGIHFRDYAAMRGAGASDADLRAILAHNGMRHVEVEFLLNWFADGKLGDVARRDDRTMFQAAEGLGARVLFLTGTLNPESAVPRAQLVEQFAALCTRASEHGITVGVEPCAWSDIDGTESARSLITDAGVRNAGLYVDVWHLYRRHTPWSDLRLVPPEMIVGIQLSDARAAPIGDLPHDALHHRLPPGEGDADVVGFVSTLHDMGVSVPVSVELFSDAQRGRSLEDAAKAAGSAPGGQ
ncbi:sugar phosphate isomerase/epimerase family protein [Microbacterium sp. A84]|uniref:sugar phosphate isomerase/epimerase family protein n=1 Tax=Microbacterium sp. A84 TaxID=3450715 RepID=UPI003F42DE77